MKKKIVLMFLVLLCSAAFAQTRYTREFRKAYSAPEEIVSLSKTMSFSQALVIFNDLSKKFLHKIIVDPQQRKFSIDVEVNRIHWMDALERILRKHDLWYKEHPDYFEIVDAVEEGTTPSVSQKKARIAFHTREVVFSAIFFETNNSRLREAGMSWDFFRGKDVNMSTRMTAADAKQGLYEIQVSPSLDFGSLLAIFKALERKQVGEVIASPQITVKSGEEGRIQVGSDIAVTIRDFAGNSITQFFSTGSIISVKPTVVRYDSIDFINLDLNIERSNSAGGTAGLEIKKSSAKTSVFLLDGEETIIGGLYINEENNKREGVPLLKDLPWWFFGLRYVFGYETKNQIKNELLILIKAELLPTLRERFVKKLNSVRNLNLVREKKQQMKQQMERFKQQWKKEQ